METNRLLGMDPPPVPGDETGGSLLPQGFRRLEERGAAGRDEQRDEGDRGEHQDDDSENPGISGVDLRENRAEQLSQRHRSEKAEDEREEGEPGPLTDDEPVEAAGRGAHRKPYAELAASARGGMSKEAVDSHRREKEGDAAEEAEDLREDDEREPGAALERRQVARVPHGERGGQL